MHLYQAHQTSPARPSRPSNASISASSSSTITNFPNFPLNQQQQPMYNPNGRKTLFQHCLKDIAVPRALQEGIQVLRVFANGKTTSMTMKLSDDKFTLFLNHGIPGKSPTKRLSFLPTWKNGNELDRVIDVGGISEIQRGHSRRNFQLARYATFCVFLFHRQSCPMQCSHTFYVSCSIHPTGVGQTPSSPWWAMSVWKTPRSPHNKVIWMFWIHHFAFPFCFGELGRWISWCHRPPLPLVGMKFSVLWIK